MSLKVYLASRDSTKDEIKKLSLALPAGVVCTSTWLDEKSDANITLPQAAKELGEAEMIEIAKCDLTDILRADVIVLFTVDPTVPTVRGGRHFESGFAYALQTLQQFGWLRAFPGKKWRFVTVGPRENIFHYLEDVLNFPTWEECKSYLEKLANGDKEKQHGKQLEFPHEENDHNSRCVA